MSSVQSFSQSIPDSPDDRSNIVIVPDAPDLPTYHPKFYIQEGMATFLVEKRLFKVHHHFLVRESEKFKSIIMRPRSPSDDVIALSDVTCHEFECLLDFFYNAMHEDYNPTFHEWLALLSISTCYGMDKIRQHAISHVENHPQEMDPIWKIQLAKRHGIYKWLVPAYVDLCQRAEPLQMCEAERLGLTTTVKLARAREMNRASVPTSLKVDDDMSPPMWPETIICPPSGKPTPQADDFRTQTCAEQARTIAIVRRVFWPESHVTVSPANADLRGKKRTMGKR